MARGPAVISDNFDSYTDGLLQSVSGGNWRNWHDYMGRQSVASGAVYTGATEDIGSVWTGASAGSLSVNQWAAVRLIAFEFENGWGGLLLRASTDYDDNGSNTRDAYELRVHDSNGTGTAVRTTQIVRVLNGTATVLTNIGVEWAPNDILIGEVEGADPVELRIYRDRGGTITLVATATDSDSSRITTYNRVGMCNRRGVTLDDFNAGNLVGLSISEVGNNDVIASDQAGVVITGAGFDVDAVEIRQGTTIVEQDIVDADDESIEFDVVFETTSGEDLKFGAATLAVINADEQEATHSITIVPPSGHLYVDVGTPNTTADNRITAVSDLVSGDQLWARGVGGGAAPTGLQLNADATFQFSIGNTPTSFDVRAWDASDSTWGDWATQSITTGTVELEGIVSICATIASPGTLRAGALAAFGGVASLVAVPAAAGTFVSDVTQRFDGVPAICAAIASPGTLRAGALAAFEGVASLVAVPAAAGTFVLDVTQRFDGVPAICAVDAQAGTAEYILPQIFDGSPSVCAVVARPGALPRTADGMAGGELGSGRLGRRGIGSGELVNPPWLEET